MSKTRSVDVAVEDNEETLHSVEKIHKRSLVKGEERFLVEWEGHPDRKDFTWEPRAHLKNCELFYKFLETTKKRGVSKKRKRTYSEMEGKEGSKGRGGWVSKKPERKEKKILVKKLFTPTTRGSLGERDRLDIVIRQGMKCNLCLTSFHHLLHELTFEIDHIIPLEQGGKDERGNMQALCPACHIYKTSTLDKGVIARLLQASRGSGIIPTRTEILEQCQIMYRNRHRLNPPHREDEMIEFAISAREILSEMCKRKVDRMLHMKELMHSGSEDEESDTKMDVGMRTERVQKKKKARPAVPPVREPTRKRRRRSKRSVTPPDSNKESPKESPMSPLEHLAFLIEQMEWLRMESSVLRMAGFRLTITLDLDAQNVIDKTSVQFRKDLDEFFRVCISGSATTVEKKLQDITLHYQQRSE